MWTRRKKYVCPVVEGEVGVSDVGAQTQKRTTL